MDNCRTRGLVLCVSDHGESDKIVTFFSPDLGRATAIAKGAKRSKKRFVNKLEPYSLLELHYTPPRREGLHFLHQAELENAFLHLRHHYTPYIAAAFIGEVTLRFTRENDPDPSLFPLLLWSMERLEHGRPALEVCSIFLLRILGTAGYQPNLDRCGSCGETVQQGMAYWLHNGGGQLLCGQCLPVNKRGNTPISLQTIKFMNHAQQASLSALQRLRVPDTNAREALQVLHRYTLHLLQQEIHSWQQIANLFDK